MQSKLPNVGTTIFTTMSQLAHECNAINLGQGFPDFPMDDALINAVAKAMRYGHNQYAYMNGVPALTNAIAEKIKKLYNTKIEAATQITVTPGATYAIYTALTAILFPGDEVILFEPAYDSYIPNIEINGAIPVLIPLTFPDYSIPWENVKEKISKKTKAIIINSPQNPTGAVLSRQDLEELQKITEGTGIYIISDEVYEHLIFDGLQHETVMKYPGLLDRSIACFSFGKTYHCTGWKMGYCVGGIALMKEFRKVHQYNAFTTNSFVQYALAEYLQNENAYLALPNLMQQKRDYFLECMQQTRFQPLTSHGSYFQCYSYAHMNEENDLDFAKKITREFGVATIPLSSFYKNGLDNKVLRFCFAKKEATLLQAAERLGKV